MDQKDSVNAVIFFADSFTWPEALRSFMQAEAELFAEPLELLTSLAPEYPLAPSEKIVESRVKILSFLVDQVTIRCLKMTVLFVSSGSQLDTFNVVLVMYVHVIMHFRSC